MNDDGPNIAGDEAPTTGVTQASAEFNKRKKSKPRGRKGGKKVVKKTKKAKAKTKVTTERRRKSYEIVSGRPTSRYPDPRKGTVPAAIWAALKSKKRTTTLEIALAIRGKVKSRSAKNLTDLTGHVGWYFHQWKKLGILRVAKA